MPRQLVIGDIHGALRALKQVLERAAVTTDDQLIFLGDYVDGWSESPQVIAFLLELQETHSCVFIRGNHDTWCENWLRGAAPDKVWYHHGGRLTILGYEALSAEERTWHLTFFERMQHFVADDADRLFVHAGFTSMHGPAQEHHDSNYSWDRTLWEVAKVAHNRVQKEEAAFPTRLGLFSEIFIGHTPTIYLGETKPLLRANVWNLDTGAAFTGPLSIMDIHTKEVWQSDPVVELYPFEKGRN